MELKRPIRTAMQVAILAAAVIVAGAVTARTGALEPPIDVEAPLHEPTWPDPLEPIVIGPKDEVGQQSVEQAQQVSSTTSQARQAAQNRFDRALENFRRALMALRNAKDQFTDVVIRHYRCSPCEVIADHWSSAARLQALLDRLAAMLAQAQARVSAQLPQARQQAAEAEQVAQEDS